MLLAEEQPLPDQLLIIKAPLSTKLRIDHRQGDAVARFYFTNPPSEILSSLDQQRGPFAHTFVQESLERNRLTVRVLLSTDALQIASKRVKHPSAWVISLTPRTTPYFPPRSALIGRLIGIVHVPSRPTLFADAPRDTPCSGNPKGEHLLSKDTLNISTEQALEKFTDAVVEPRCRTWLTSQLARQRLEAGGNIDIFQRWAFIFSSDQDTWATHTRAYSQASIIAAEVLSRLEYIPEADLILRDRRRFHTREYVSRTMALANHLSRIGQYNHAETLYGQLLRKGFQPQIIYSASLGRLRNFIAGNDPIGALKSVEEAFRSLPEVDQLPNTLWSLGGEGALAQDQPGLARKYFTRAARSKGRKGQALALIRLGDLEHSINRLESATTGWDMALKKGGNCNQAHIHLRKIVAFEPNISEILIVLKKLRRFSACFDVQLEAEYALGVIHLYRNNISEALDVARKIANRGTKKWGLKAPQQSLIGRVAEKSIASYERHMEFAEIVDLYEKELYPYRNRLDLLTKYRIAKAFDRIGTSERSAYELLELLVKNPNLEFQQDLIFTLGEVLIRANDLYRSDLILRHLSTSKQKKSNEWRYHRLAGLHDIASARPKSGIIQLRKAKKLLPSGDRRRKLEFHLASAYISTADIENAAYSLISATKSLSISAEKLLPVSITLLSECLRVCSQNVLKDLYFAVLSRIKYADLPSRIKAQLRLREIYPATEIEQSDDETRHQELWNRLTTLGLAEIADSTVEKR